MGARADVGMGVGLGVGVGVGVGIGLAVCYISTLRKPKSYVDRNDLQNNTRWQ